MVDVIPVPIATVRDSQATEKVLRELGRRIGRARIAANLTQEEAAAACGIDYKRWQELEAGRVNATMRTLVRVAKALRIGVWDLLGSAPVSEATPRKRVRPRAT
jgi:transcriptional regulator with XRE-family HTH domain